MKAVLISEAQCDKAAAAVAVHVGSLCEKPWATDGLAHFLEHMLFLGTEKYPEEESYKKFLSKNGGGCNASTSDEFTRYTLGSLFRLCSVLVHRYYLHVKPTVLEEAVDRLSQFFLPYGGGGPLMDASCTDREMNAVHSEHQKNLQNEARRAMQVFRYEADSNHPLHHFRTGFVLAVPFSRFCRAWCITPCWKGNLETLKKEGIRDVLLDFHKNFYSANLMAVSIIGKESLDELEDLVRSRFSGVVNKNASIPKFKWPFPKYGDFGAWEDKEATFLGVGGTNPNPNPNNTLPIVTCIEPCKEERYVSFQFFTPPVEHLWKEKVHVLALQLLTVRELVP